MALKATVLKESSAFTLMCSLHIISRSHSNLFFFGLSCEKQKFVQINILQQRLFVLTTAFGQFGQVLVLYLLSIHGSF